MDALNKKASKLAIKGSARFKKELRTVSVPKIFAFVTLANASLNSRASIVLKCILALYLLTGGHLQGEGLKTESNADNPCLQSRRLH